MAQAHADALAGKTFSLRALIARSFAYHILTLALAAAFTLIAPNFMGQSYPEYVFVLSLIQLFVLYLSIGSAGLFNRFVQQVDRAGVDALFYYALRMKTVFFLPLILAAGIYSWWRESAFFLLLPTMAWLFCLLEALFLLMYSMEQYRVNFHSPLAHGLARLAFLPVSSLSLLFYIFVCELVRGLVIARSVLSVYTLRGLTGLFRPPPDRPPSLPEPKLMRKVVYETYLINLLFYALPLFPVLVMKRTVVEGLRDMTIMYVIAMSLVLRPLSAIHNVILPRLVANRHRKGRILGFLAGTGGLSLVVSSLLGVLFFVFGRHVSAYYGMEDHSSIYWLLVYSGCVLMLNSCRQVVYLYDRTRPLILALVCFYGLSTAALLATARSLAEVLTVFILALLATGVSLAVLVVGQARSTCAPE